MEFRGLVDGRIDVLLQALKLKVHDGQAILVVGGHPSMGHSKA
jgi:hypothetical protein